VTYLAPKSRFQWNNTK